MQLVGTIQNYWADFVALLYPRLCGACGDHLNKGEETICLSCQFDLPLTGFHKDPESPIAKRFWGRVPLQQATALYYFSKGGKVQHMIHELKYHGRTDVGEFMGRQLGRELHKDGALADIDAIIPVPLHPKKQRQRGYNQSEHFASGIAQVLQVPVLAEALSRVSYTESQTQKSREDRWLNVKDVFEVTDPTILEGQHLLLVDDVMTTGATLEACAYKLLAVPGTRVSVATIAMAE